MIEGAVEQTESVDIEKRKGRVGERRGQDKWADSAAAAEKRRTKKARWRKKDQMEERQAKD
jgi:hypothetical protein